MHHQSPLLRLDGITVRTFARLPAPVIALVLKGAEIGPLRYWEIITAPRTLAALQLTLTAAGIATVFNAVYGLLMAWVLVRYEFPVQRRFLSFAALGLPQHRLPRLHSPWRQCLPV